MTSTGIVQNKLIELDESIRQQDLNMFSAYLAEELEEWTLSEVRKCLVEKLEEQKLLFMQLMDETYRASRDVQERESEKVYIGGASQVLESPEFADVEK